jgi:F0F1-type ATP synthase assembly protein I
LATDPRPPSASAPQRKRPTGFLRQIALAMQLPMFPLGGAIAGGVAGYFLDRVAHTGRALTLLFGAIGVAAGLAEMIRRATHQEKQDGDV